MSYRERAETIVQEPLCVNLYERLVKLISEADRELAQFQADEKEEADFMIKNGIIWDCNFIDGWQDVLHELDNLKADLAQAQAERDQAVADNAAMICQEPDHRCPECEADWMAGRPITCRKNPSPGQHLLDRIKKLEAIVAKQIKHCPTCRGVGVIGKSEIIGPTTSCPTCKEARAALDKTKGEKK